MLDRFRSVALSLSVLVAVSGVVLYVLVISGGGSSLFGDSEGALETTDFASLDYTPMDRGFLLCSRGTCPTAVADGETAAFPVGVRALRLALLDFTDNQRYIQSQSVNILDNQFEFLERLPGKQFPAVVAVKLVEIDERNSGLVLYSYQPVGDSRSTDHADRVMRWLKRIEENL